MLLCPVLCNEAYQNAHFCPTIGSVKVWWASSYCSVCSPVWVWFLQIHSLPSQVRIQTSGDVTSWNSKKDSKECYQTAKTSVLFAVVLLFSVAVVSCNIHYMGTGAMVMD